MHLYACPLWSVFGPRPSSLSYNMQHTMSEPNSIFLLAAPSSGLEMRKGLKLLFGPHSCNCKLRIFLSIDGQLFSELSFVSWVICPSSPACCRDCQSLLKDSIFTLAFDRNSGARCWRLWEYAKSSKGRGAIFSILFRMFHPFCTLFAEF